LNPAPLLPFWEKGLGDEGNEFAKVECIRWALRRCLILLGAVRSAAPNKKSSLRHFLKPLILRARSARKIKGFKKWRACC